MIGVSMMPISIPSTSLELSTEDPRESFQPIRPGPGDW